MGMRIACRRLAGQLHLCLRNRAHGHHHRSVEAAGRTADEVGDVHRHQGAAFHISHADPRVDQRVLESQAAAEQESDEVRPPSASSATAIRRKNGRCSLYQTHLDCRSGRL